MMALKHSQVLRTIPFLIATCHCERSAAIRFRGCVATAVLLLAIVSTATAKYSGGSGTALDPYQIATAADLILLSESPADYDKHFLLTADIDLDPNLPGRKVFDKAVIAPDMDPVKDYFQGPSFTGVFDGGSHLISRLTITGASYLGLFGHLESKAEVKDLGVVDVNIVGSGSYIGALAVENVGKVTQCYSTGFVTGGGDMVGGLVADNRNGGFLTACYTTGSVTKSRRYVGGLVGANEGSLVACYAAGPVVGVDCIGGLVGWNNGWLRACYATGDVNCSWWRVGGLVGINFNRGSLMACYATGSVTGGSEVGGLVGRIGWNFGRLDNSYATGSVAGTSCVGGLVGLITSDSPVRLRACYAAGLVAGGSDHLGGLVGYYGNGSVTGCFWDTQTSGQVASPAGTGKTTVEMQTAAAFLDAGWDFVGETKNGTEDLWWILEGKDYPRLAWELPGKYGGGTGEPNDPYLIFTAGQMNTIGAEPNDWGKHFKLMADIDLSGYDGKDGRPAFNIIAPDADPAKVLFQGTLFTGRFDGNGHTISHLTVKGGESLGLFGRLGSGAQVRGLGVVDVNITGSGDEVGGLAGYSEGGVANCYSSGVVKGRYDVGGLVGWNESGTLTHCYSRSTVIARSHVGGLAGYNGGTLTQCHSTGVVSGTQDFVGGLVGWKDWWYYRSVIDGFWDTQTSGQATSAGGTGKTTAEMQTAGTFFDWGICGNEGVWTIEEGKDYPRLSWENKPGQPIEARLSDFLTGEGTQGDPYLIYTREDIDVIAWFPCERDAHFRLMFVEGEGTQDSPYLLSTADQLNLIGMLQKEWDKHYKLLAGIDLSAFDGKDGRPAFKVIGTQATPFTGIFDGDGHALSHLTITGKDYYLGLFGQLASRAEVRDLRIVDVNISGSYYVGGLAGRTDGTLIRCYSAGEINGTHYVGGLAGHNNGTMAECTSTGTAGGTGDCVGGLAGRNTGTVTQCCSSGGVSSGGVNGYVGGLVGFNDNGIVTGCYSTGPVGGSQFVVGLVGYNYRGTVTHCYSTGPVSGSNFIGGAVGYNDHGPVTRCYSIGAVRGERYIGGLVGTTYFGIALNSFWDTQTSGQRTSAGGTGKTTAEMQAAKTFLNAGWDFVSEAANGTADLWWILEGKDYPRLWWEAAKK